MEGVSSSSTIYPHVERIHITVSPSETLNLKLTAWSQSLLCLRKLAIMLVALRKVLSASAVTWKQGPALPGLQRRASGRG